MKKLFAIMTVIAMCFVFAACSGNQKDPASSGIVGNDSKVESVKPSDLVLNPLTGENTLNKTAVNKRPVSIMINNYKGSLPQRGIAKADLYYEVLAEGGISRILAIFADVNSIPDIGSLRSARHYFLSLAMAHNAIYCHFGGSPYALEYIKQNNIDTINFMTTSASYRDQNRVGKYAYEHTAFTDGQRLAKAISNRKIKTDAKIDNAFNFGDNAAVLSKGNSAANITVPLSNSTKSTFTYDSATGLYKKGQFGADHIDEATGKALEVKNVFVLQTEIGKLEQNYGNDSRLDVDLSSGTGYYACDGKIVHINWKKGGYTDPFKYYTLDGKELTVAPGKAWVTIISEGNTVSYN